MPPGTSFPASIEGKIPEEKAPDIGRMKEVFKAPTQRGHVIRNHLGKIE
jgi:hypothetical protein